MSLVARRAGVGIGTLYRRYPSKDALVAQLCLDGVRRVEAQARVALDRARSYPWGAFVGFMTGCPRRRRRPAHRGLGGHVHPDRGAARRERAACATPCRSCSTASRPPAPFAPTSPRRTSGCSSASCAPSSSTTSSAPSTLRRRYLELALAGAPRRGRGAASGPASRLGRARGRPAGRWTSDRYRLRQVQRTGSTSPGGDGCAEHTAARRRIAAARANAFVIARRRAGSRPVGRLRLMSEGQGPEVHLPIVLADIGATWRRPRRRRERLRGVPSVAVQPQPLPRCRGRCLCALSKHQERRRCPTPRSRCAPRPVRRWLVLAGDRHRCSSQRSRRLVWRWRRM